MSEWWKAKCPECGWTGLSRDCAGGGSIADTGDFEDCYCPACVRENDVWVVVEDVDDT